MTIDEAIRNLRDVASEEDSPLVLEEREAIRLGIEALKEVKKAREGDPALDGELLPGETGE
jgi:hypothetical protein